MAAIVNNKLVVIKLIKKLRCNTTEILARLCALKILNVDVYDRNLCIKTDNNTAKSAYTRNRVRLQRKQLSFDLFVEIAKLHNQSSSLETVKSNKNIADYFSRVDFKTFIKKYNCEIRSASLNDVMNANIGENIYMRIAIMECRNLDIYERGLCWKALANYVDEINEARFNVNAKMLEKQVNNFIKLESIE